MVLKKAKPPRAQTDPQNDNHRGFEDAQVIKIQIKVYYKENNKGTIRG
jgi:hypothetical protein